MMRSERKGRRIDDIDRFYGWEELPNGPLVEIAERLSNFEDFEALHIVCRRWNSVLRASHCKFLNGGHVGHCSPQVPWLMINNCCLWSSQGWFFVVTKRLTMSLYNPLCSPTQNFIPLPRNDALAASVTRFALSACPCTYSYTVMLAAFEELAFWTPGEEAWTVVKPPFDIGYTLDVTFYQGHYFALCSIGEIYMISNGDDDARKKFQSYNIGTLFSPRWTFRHLWKAYFVLVESDNKLLVVVRLALLPETQPFLKTNRDHLTAGFRVMEIFVPPTPLDSDKALVRKVRNLGDISLFVGRNQAFAVQVPDYEERVDNVSPSCYYGCKPNCIYFTDDRLDNLPFTANYGKGKDMGVYNMADGTITRHFQGFSPGDYSPMMWV